MHQRDVDEMMAAVSEQETLEAQLEQARQRKATKAELRRLGRSINAAVEREVKAEGEDTAVKPHEPRSVV